MCAGIGKAVHMYHIKVSHSIICLLVAFILCSGHGLPAHSSIDHVLVSYISVKIFLQLRRDMWKCLQAAMTEQLTDFVLLQTHYLTSHPRLNYYAIVPAGQTGPDGSDKGWWTEPHDRDRFADKATA